MNFHAWFDFIGEYEILVKTGLRRLVWLWPSPDSFIDTLLSHCSAHILLSVYSDCSRRVKKTGLALTISRLFHWYTTVTLQRSFFSRFTQTAVDGLRRLVWLWPSPDSFIDTLLSHCSAHILLSVYSDCSRRVKKTGLALTISRLFHWYTTVTLERSHSSHGLLRLQLYTRTTKAASAPCWQTLHFPVILHGTK